MHSHNQQVKKFKKNYKLSDYQAKEAVKLLKYLRYGYTEKIVKMAMERGIVTNTQKVRHIKMGFLNNPHIFNLLIQLAEKEKTSVNAAREKLNV